MSMLVFVAAVAPAIADTPYPTVPQEAQGTEGGNPTRCSHDAEVVEQVPVQVALNGYPGRTLLAGYLQLRWSPSCQGNWARFIAHQVVVNGGAWGYYGKVWVTGGVFGHTHSEKVNDNFSGSSLAFYTSMVWAPDPHCASAHVQLYDELTDVQGPSASTLCY
ncbi:MAG TPA: hypothetical protein VK680_14805 [Solirubrobacteraceae bacterium]|nr:hypothetical protein [Solirubrobacteraceae bacterium]